MKLKLLLGIGYPSLRTIYFRQTLHCVKSVHIRSFFGLYFPAFGLNTDQKNFEFRHFVYEVLLDPHKISGVSPE